MELALGAWTRFVSEVVRLKFQSLFLWNSPSEIRIRVALCSPYEVSILVFVELALGVNVGADYSTSLKSFNPCFCGTRPRSLPPGGPIGFIARFQSLFLWNSPSELLRQSRHRHLEQTVSILVFVELALGALSQPRP